MSVVKCMGVFGLVCALAACDTTDATVDDQDASGAWQADMSSEEGVEGDAAEPMNEAMDTVSEADAMPQADTMPQAEVTPEPEPVLPADVMMTVQIVNAGTGGPYAGVVVTAGDQEETTDASGRASVMVSVGPYHVVLEASDARAHHIYGVAGEVDFTQISYMSPESITLGVFGSLSLQDDATRGTLVVGLDQPNLAPAVGASASIDAASDPAFIFAGFFPQAGTTITAGGQSFVTFPNVDAGLVAVSATLPGGTCLPFPGLSGDPQVEMHPGEVSVVAFICE